MFDQYSEFNNCSDPRLKKRLVNEDLHRLYKNIKKSCDNINNIEVNIIFDSELFTSFEQYISINNILEDFSISSFPNDNMVNYLCDKIFGKIIGGQQQYFNGLITVNNNNNIIDAYSEGNININLRGSGLSVYGNGKSKIFMIIEVKNNNSIIQEMNSLEIIYDKLSRSPIISLEKFKFQDIYVKLYDLIKNEEYLSQQINITCKNKIRTWLIKNTNKNVEIDTYELDKFNIESTNWIVNKLNSRYKDTITKQQRYLDILRSKLRSLDKLDYLEANNYHKTNIGRQFTCSENRSFTDDNK